MIRIFNHYMPSASVYGALFDLCIVLLAMLGAVSFQAGSWDIAVPLAGTHAAPIAAGVFFINAATGAYEMSNARSLVDSAFRTVAALALTLLLIYAVFMLVPADLQNRATVQWATMVGAAGVILRRVYVSRAVTNTRGRTRILIYGAGPAAKLVGATLKTADKNAEIVGYVPGPNEKEPAVPASELLLGGDLLIETALSRHVDEIVVALTERRAGSMPLRELLDCKLKGIRVYDINSHFEKTLGQIRIDYVNASWLIFSDGFNQAVGRTIVKRCFDILCALLLLLVSAPVMLLASMLIRLESRGPILYRQERTGMNGAPFKVIKFRSMRTDAEKDGTPRWAALKDDRITRVGAIIRRLRIDELPQLFNVLKGDMSLVGPRPERPFFVEQLTHDIPFYAVRHSVKPGVTGWAQVRYQYGSTIEDSQEKLQYDLYYVKNHTLFLDILILLETVSVVLTGKGAR